MLISVFTPTHDPRYLNDAYRSLCDQTHTNWEWVIVPNGGAVIPEDFLKDYRVKIRPLGGIGHGIGALKRFACAQATGQIFLELDHDDQLADTCLERVAQARHDHGPGFYYSDFARLSADASNQVVPMQYSRETGWESYEFDYRGRTCIAVRAFEPCARSLHQIGWAPNHVRAWAREVYESVGGHDPALAVIDDLDLLCRTYIAGVPFVRIAEPLYFYREHDSGGLANSYRGLTTEIHDRNAQVSQRYTRQLIDAWATRRFLPKIDLGGRIGCPAGYISLDCRPGAELRADALRLPFADASVGVLRASDFLEHLPAGSAVAAMNEFYRVLVPGGWLTTDTPSTGGYGAFCDPTHTSFWNYLSFRYYTDRTFAQYIPEIQCRFAVAALSEDFPTPWHAERNLLYVHADLFALKGQRVPGPVLI
jgi:glycosyltransferase involved in cell wall biosynthesis